MKKYILSALALSAFFVACSNEETQVPAGENQKVNFVLDNLVSRTVTSGNTTTFVEGDQIGISSSGLEMDMNNVTYTVTANGGLTGGSFYYDGNNKATFYAHYPYSATYAEGSVTLTVPAEQVTDSAFNACDFLTSTATGDPASGGTVVLKFKHRLALVKVVWNGSTTATGVTLRGVKPVATWTQATDVVATSGNAIDINTWKIAADKQEYWAMIPEQTVGTTSPLLTIVDVDKNYEFTPSGNISFSANTVKKITLNLNEQGSVEATISDLEINNWEEDSNDGGGYVEEAPAVALIDTVAGQNITLTTGMTKATAEAGKWNVAVVEGNTIEWDTTENAIHMNVDTLNANNEVISGKWWDNAIYYRPSASLAAQIKPTVYKLTFKAKASAALKGFMVQVMKGDESANTYFGIFNADPATKDEVTWARMYYPSFKEELFTDGAMEYQDMTYWVDFSKIIDAAGNETIEGKAGDYEKVLLTLSVNTGTSAANAYGVDFHFKDFTFVEVKE